jgi:hypothetical protein
MRQDFEKRYGNKSPIVPQGEFWATARRRKPVVPLGFEVIYNY